MKILPFIGVHSVSVSQNPDTDTLNAFSNTGNNSVFITCPTNLHASGRQHHTSLFPFHSKENDAPITKLIGNQAGASTATKNKPLSVQR
ncbi:hypothetical protein XF_2337 [Xylella fastidiosa 9a5c]|uniref:Uncharacterized protein n=1 Tax=Xylella fastidiosa (strain 9a5c) TaxID=160492 RepID=Q9PB08_XYLFA|nr:hypothetical protein XF_2337 [Xylella fastidiosa 9a5c]